MPRHSFIQMQKLTNVKGRINYISSPARQENLYTVCETTDRAFWNSLAKENQYEFKKSGTAGKCIEARELIIALPESYTEHDPNVILGIFTEYFKFKYGVECISALHHNKRKTNYHIHLIFSEWEKLDEPIEKIATRNMFYNEQGKRVRTKKEIVNEDGEVRDGCKIVAKGNIYERNIFGKKNANFKSDMFLKEVKQEYTDLINHFLKDRSQSLQVYDNTSVYLPTKKIGKNNPKVEEIKADNEIRLEWNQTADIALIAGIEKEMISDVKRNEISSKIKVSITENGQQPSLFRGIVKRAIAFLKRTIEKIQIPPKPEMPYESRKLAEMGKVLSELQKCKEALYQIESIEIPSLEYKLSSAMGIFKGKERQEIQEKINACQKKAKVIKTKMPLIVKSEGYENIEAFVFQYNRALKMHKEYRTALDNWKIKYENQEQISSIRVRLDAEKRRRGEVEKGTKKGVKRQLLSR